MAQSDVVEIMKRHPGPHTMAEIASLLPNMSPRTVGNNVSMARKTRKLEVVGSKEQPHNHRPALLYALAEG